MENEHGRARKLLSHEDYELHLQYGFGFFSQFHLEDVCGEPGCEQTDYVSFAS